METIPKFAGNKHVFSFDVTFGELFSESFANFFFVLIDPGFIDVSVASIKGSLGSFVNLAFLRQPSS